MTKKFFSTPTQRVRGILRIKDVIRNNLDSLPDDLKELKDKKEIEILEGDELVTFIKKT